MNNADKNKSQQQAIDREALEFERVHGRKPDMLKFGDLQEVQCNAEKKNPELFNRVTEGSISRYVPEPEKETSYHPAIAQKGEVNIDSAKIGGRNGLREMERAFRSGGFDEIAEQFNRAANRDTIAQRVDLNKRK